jgi:hypothetical protein
LIFVKIVKRALKVSTHISFSYYFNAAFKKLLHIGCKANLGISLADHCPKFKICSLPSVCDFLIIAREVNRFIVF